MSKTTGKKAASAEPRSTPPAATNTSEATGQAGAAGTLPGATPPAAPGSETSSISAASDLAAGAAGGENAGTNTHPADQERNGMATEPTGESLSASGPDATARAADMEVPPSGEAAEAPVVLRVKATQARGFWRLGRYWPAEVTEVRAGELTDDQIAALRAEPMLKVEDAA